VYISAVIVARWWGQIAGSLIVSLAVMCDAAAGIEISGGNGSKAVHGYRHIALPIHMTHPPRQRFSIVGWYYRLLTCFYFPEFPSRSGGEELLGDLLRGCRMAT
jgi:hypothetical protein